MGVITFNGQSSSDYGILVEHPPGYHIPARDYEYIHVPGRNGDLIIDKGSFQNGRRSYEIAFGDTTKNHAEMANQVAKWLHSASGYAKIYDTYDPYWYQLASYVDEVDIENILFHAGRAEIEFNCKPQKYRQDYNEQTGVATEIIYSDPTQPEGSRALRISGTLYDRTSRPSRPHIKITAKLSSSAPAGTTGGVLLYMNGVTSSDRVMDISNVAVSTQESSIEIDCDLMDVYSGTTNRNSDAVLRTSSFPLLTLNENNYYIVQVNPASNDVILTGLEVTPRWWTL